MLATAYYIQPIEENFLGDSIETLKKKVESFFFKNSKKHPKKMKEIEKKLRNGGIDVSKIKDDAKKAANNTKIKDKKITNLPEVIKKFTSDLANRKYFVDSGKRSTNIELNPIDKAAVGIVKSLGLLAVVFFLNTYLISLAITLTGDFTLGHAIGAIFVAPIVEETSKLISVKNDFTWEYFTTFNIAEFSLYVSGMIDAGLDPITAILVRIPPVCMHLFNTIIHSEAHKTGKSEEGFTWTVTIHAIWNTLATLRTI